MSDFFSSAQWTAADQASGAKTAGAWDQFFSTRQATPADDAGELEASARATEAQKRHEDRLLTFDNVVGVAASLKVTNGKPTRTWSVTVLVEQKLPLTKVAVASRVPKDLDDVPTDVVEVGRPVPLTFNTKVRPALPGYSIGHFNITAGTFGCLVRDVRRCCRKSEQGCCEGESHQDCKGDYLILSNNHVLAAVNTGKPGDLILQPGAFDGGLYPSDAVAELDRFEPIVFGRAGYNLVDCAVARPLHSRNVGASIIGVVMPTAIGQASIGLPVIKAGRTTQVTTGRVIATNATVSVFYGAPGVATFRHQILTTAMSAPGDSGSLLMSRTLNTVGLLFAGSAQITIFNHLSDVEVALGVRPVTALR
jgi:hypothetical protein